MCLESQNRHVCINRVQKVNLVMADMNRVKKINIVMADMNHVKKINIDMADMNRVKKVNIDMANMSSCGQESRNSHSCAQKVKIDMSA
jgi:enamine deaminase RidA (YjgF/YER057c/UK114 family)